VLVVSFFPDPPRSTVNVGGDCVQAATTTSALASCQF